jgi:conjugal transfer pilus assembly protein TraW
VKKLLIGITLATLASASYAKDYGVQGNQWPVTEVDIRQLMVSQAAAVDWSKPQAQVKESAARFLDNLPKRQLPLAERTQTAWFDPSIVLTSDIQVPVKQKDGSYVWQVLYPKGTRVNPLEKYHPVTAMLFFDGSQEDQVKMVQDVLAKEPNRIMVVAAGAGDLKTLNETLKRPVFYANDALINRFQVKYLPSLVYPGDGAQSLYIGITSFGLPFDANQVVQSWPALRPATPSTPSGMQK